jgi:type II secretory pathway component PulC
MTFPSRVLSLVARLLPWFERAVVVVVCWQAAGLVWWLFAPSTAGPMPAPPRPFPVHSESRDTFLGWFGNETVADAQTVSDYTLMAVIAGRDGVALFKGSDNKGIAVRTGDTLDSASRLLAVEPGAAMIERGGVRQEVKLPQVELRPIFSDPGKEASNADKSVSGAAVGNAPARTVATKAVRLTRGQMVTVMRGGDVANWDKGLSNTPDGGIRIDQVAAQPFAGLLQLKDGDVLKKINKRPLARLADVSLIFFHFGRDASIDIELIRNGVSMTQHYDIQP